MEELLSEMSPAEQAAYWRRENQRENLNLLNSLHESIQLDKRMITSTKQWLYQCAYHTADDAKLKELLILGADIISLSEASINVTRSLIAHYTKYPLYSEKRKQWVKTKEGQLWYKKNLPKTN